MSLTKCLCFGSYRLKEKKFKLLTSILGLAFIIAAGIPFPAEAAAPRFDYVGSKTVLEGETVTFDIKANDPDGDPVSIAMVSRPSGSVLTETGQNSAAFTWDSDYIGPNSSEGSPFEVVFRVSDGALSDLMTVQVNVINNNRAPVIEPAETVSFDSGELVSFGLSGIDPDNDPVSWAIIDAPSGLEISSAGRSGLLSWQTSFADSGTYPVEVALSDIYGASDTVSFMLELAAVEVYRLSISEATGYPTEQVSLSVNLMNQEPITGLNLLINYDASALLLASVTDLGTRAEDFEYFTYHLNYNNQSGDIQVLATFDTDGFGEANLGVGDGSILDLRFYITGDYQYSGYAIPVRFIFKDIFYKTDNTLFDTEGKRIEQEAIVYDDGQVLIKKADQSSIGDININGVAYEISDVVYYINYFIYTGQFPLNPEQRANADVNQDGISPTIADLVYMINGLINVNSTNGDSEKPRYDGDPVAVSIDDNTDEFSLGYESGVELGGLALTLATDGGPVDIGAVISDFEMSGLTVKKNIEDEKVRLLIYGENGAVLPAGNHRFVKINSENGFNIEKVEFATSDGATIPAVMKGSGILPEGFALYQNYPNPFNPSTEIRFELPRTSEVELTVYNLLGQEIKTLTDGRLPAGSHSVIWDGTNNEGTAVSSGIYFYRLQAGEYLDRKKMVLLK